MRYILRLSTAAFENSNAKMQMKASSALRLSISRLKLREEGVLNVSTLQNHQTIYCHACILVLIC